MSGPAGRPGRIRVGLSGWVYREWRGDFYPPGLAQRRELAHVAARFPAVEVNASFYRLQRPQTYLGWAEQVPEDFVFAVKGGRYLTHLKRLAGVEGALANFLASGPLALGARLGPLLWQLPPALAWEGPGRERVEAFLDLLPRTTARAAALAAGHEEQLAGRAWTTTDADRPLRHALEVRHPSFADPSAAAALRAAGVALVLADAGGRWPVLREVTADFAYLRLHGETEAYTSGYSPAALERWAQVAREEAAAGRDVYVFFDNDVGGHAPRDAAALVALLARTGAG